LNYLILCFKPRDNADWPEYLIAHDLHIMRGTGQDRRLDKKALLAPARATSFDLCAIVDAALDVSIYNCQ
jgi:hypothetical protein